MFSENFAQVALCTGIGGSIRGLHNLISGTERSHFIEDNFTAIRWVGLVL